MREINLFIIHLIKILELIYNIGLFIAMIVKVNSFSRENDKFNDPLAKTVCSGEQVSDNVACIKKSEWNLIYFCIILAFFHVVHTNLLTNIRLKLRD
jgi:hypothetical protein